MPCGCSHIGFELVMEVILQIGAAKLCYSCLITLRLQDMIDSGSAVGVIVLVCENDCFVVFTVKISEQFIVCSWIYRENFFEVLFKRLSICLAEGFRARFGFPVIDINEQIVTMDVKFDF